MRLSGNKGSCAAHPQKHVTYCGFHEQGGWPLSGDSNAVHLCARYQLAFALLVVGLLPGLKHPIEAYDPVFNDIDRAFLQGLGVKVAESPNI